MSSASSIISLVDAEATRQFGIWLGRELQPGNVLLLEGDLGSGKTTLVQGIGAGLGISTTIDSPTFTLINEYLSGRLPLYHFDLYRLDGNETIALHPEVYWEGIEVEPGIVAIEWAERLLYKPANYYLVRLQYNAELGRQAELISVGESTSEILDRLGSSLA